MRLVDSHAHLQAAAFADDAEEVLAAARAAGVERILVPGWDLPSSAAARDLALRAGVGASAGIHPHVAAEVDEDAWRQIVEIAGDGRVVAVGETGLDYDRGFSPRDAQLANLRRHLALGRELGKPIILHCRSKPGLRDAQDDLLRELSEAGAGTSAWPLGEGRAPALLHSFSGPLDYAERAIAMGVAVSFSGLVFRRGEEVSAMVGAAVPADLLLVETDSPYLSAPGAPRRRNEPQYVGLTARWLAAQRGTDADQLGALLVLNYDRIFGHSDPPG